MIPGPGDETTATAGLNHDHFRASQADREVVIGTLKAAFVHGRLTGDELGARTGRVYASRTYAELAEVTAEVTADIPVEPGAARLPRDPWRATKIAWRIEYALILPGIAWVLFIPPGPHTSAGELVALGVGTYLLFWAIGIFIRVVSRSAKRAGEPSAPGAGSELLHASHAVARDQVTRILGAALAQGRLTEDEHDERAARVPRSRVQADLDTLIADLPAGLAAKPPTARDAWIGTGAIAAAASVIVAVVLLRPDTYLAFAAFLAAAATLILAAPVTAGLMIDRRHQQRISRR